MKNKITIPFVSIVLTFSGMFSSATVLAANAATAVVVPCDGTAIPGQFAQAFTVSPGESVNIISDPAGSCDTYFSQAGGIFPLFPDVVSLPPRIM